MIRAAALAVELAWSAPAECPDAARARVQLQEQLHGEQGDASAKVEITATDRGWMATVAIEAGEPLVPRTLVAADCEAVARAAVLVIAVAIDPIAIAKELDDPQPAPLVPPPLGGIAAAPSTAPNGSSPTPTRTRAASRDRDRPSTHALRIAGGVGYQVVPAIGGAVQLAYALGRPRWRLEALAQYQPRIDRYYRDGTDAGGRVQVLSFALRACPTPRLGRVTFPICIGLEAGPVIGRGLGVSRRERAVTAWVAAQAGLGLVVAVHRVVGIALGTELIATLAQPVFHVGERDRLFTTPWVGGRALVGLEFRLR